MKKYIKKKPKIAIVHDNFCYVGGGERVLFALHEIWPEAPIYTTTIYWKNLGSGYRDVQSLRPITSWVQKIPFFAQYPFLFRYLLPFIWRSFDFSKYDIVISSSGAQMSHLIQVKKGTMHICYCHTPPRHLYGYQTDFNWKRNRLVKLLVNLFNNYLLRVDYLSAQKVRYFIANSNEVALRIKKIYDRDSIVIPPPCIFSSSKTKEIRSGNYFLVVSRLSRMKHIDIIIQACKKINLSLIIVGIGPEWDNLHMTADSHVSFLGQVDDNELAKLYQNCKAVICVAEDEDFGIVPIEAMHFGKPVIAYYSGGHKETIIEGKTGVFFKELTVGSLIEAIKKLSTYRISAENCQKNVQKFSLEVFKSRVKKIVDSKYYEYIATQSS